MEDSSHLSADETVCSGDEKPASEKVMVLLFMAIP
jgi:hypothetical protein